MSTNNLPALSNAQVPAYLAARMGTPSQLIANALAGASSSVPRISLKQSRFRLIEGGDEFVLDTLHLDAAIVDITPGISKTFYLKQYSPGDEPKAPDCHSVLGDAPSADASAPQHTNCAECAQNAWGSKITPQGKETRACSDSRRIAIVAADDPSGTLYQLGIPAASMKDFGKYIKELAMRGFNPEMVRTRISFDPTTDFPKLTFVFAGFLTEEAYAAVAPRVMSSESQDVLGLLGMKSRAPALPAPVTPVAQQPAPIVQQAVEQTKSFGKPAAAVQEAVQQEAPVQEKKPRGFGGKKADTAVHAPAPQQAAPVVVSSGLGDLEAELADALGTLDLG